MSQYTIEARSLKQAGIGSHNFWVLRDERGGGVAELHGMATDRKTRGIGFTGTNSEKDSLKVRHFVHNHTHQDTPALIVPIDYVGRTFVRHEQASQIVFSGSREEVLARWSKAVNAIPELNKQNLDYPPYGVSLMEKTVNSNSAYRTLGELMGVRIHNFPGVIEPGINNKMQSYSEADNYQHSKQESKGTEYNFNQPEQTKTAKEQIRDAFGEIYQGIRTEPFKNVLPKDVWEQLGFKVPDKAKGAEVALKGEDGKIQMVKMYHLGEFNLLAKDLADATQKTEDRFKESVNTEAGKRGILPPFPERNKNLEPENER